MENNDNNSGVNVETNVSQNTQPKKGSSKKILILVIILALFGIGIGSYAMLNRTGKLDNLNLSPKESFLKLGEAGVKTACKDIASIPTTGKFNTSVTLSIDELKGSDELEQYLQLFDLSDINIDSVSDVDNGVSEMTLSTRVMNTDVTAKIKADNTTMLIESNLLKDGPVYVDLNSQTGTDFSPISPAEYSAIFSEEEIMYFYNRYVKDLISTNVPDENFTIIRDVEFNGSARDCIEMQLTNEAFVKIIPALGNSLNEDEKLVDFLKTIYGGMLSTDEIKSGIKLLTYNMTEEDLVPEDMGIKDLKVKFYRNNDGNPCGMEFLVETQSGESSKLTIVFDESVFSLKLLDDENELFNMVINSTKTDDNTSADVDITAGELKIGLNVVYSMNEDEGIVISPVDLSGATEITDIDDIQDLIDFSIFYENMMME